MNYIVRVYRQPVFISFSKKAKIKNSQIIRTKVRVYPDYNAMMATALDSTSSIAFIFRSLFPVWNWRLTDRQCTEAR